eukprot:scpid4556/ scgid3103/ Integrin beta-1; Fibronectin receptor subunit beta; Integrin subunit beta-1; VLA-4 subunit beta
MEVSAMAWLMLALCLAVVLRAANAQDCSVARTCAQCLDTAPACLWCSDRLQEFQERPRCGTSLPGCTNITNIQSQTPINHTIASPIGPEVQVTPQQVSASVRSHDTFTVDVTLTPAANFPLDVYYLMDHSFSFHDDLDTLKAQASAIGNDIRRVSQNSRIGFGSFVDKTTAPYVVTQNNTVISQCLGCKLPYSFENTFPLSTDTAGFVTSVSSQRISGNVDTAEGTLEALMQVLVCTDKIGWRDNARRVLVVATDAIYHTAGDGKLAGIVLPNNAQCQLDDNGRYTGWSQFDYPSIGQLNSIIQDRNILVVFAVTGGVREEYDFVTNFLQGTIRQELRADSRNLQQLLVIELTRQIRQALPNVIVEDGIRIRSLQATCPGGSSEIVIQGDNLQGCDGLFEGAIAQFRITAEAGSCADLQAGGGRAVVRFTGFGDVEILATGLCECPCQTVAPEVNSTFCHNQGDEQCGVCDCLEGFSNEGRLGRCDCSLDNFKPCIQNGTSLVCSDRGDCVCQTCRCEPLSNGTYCECDNGNCERGGENNELCSGNGVCECGECRCLDGYVGVACECATSNSRCRRTTGNDMRLCSGQGFCDCGRCQCLSGFSGAFCETCIGGPTVCDFGICERSSFCLDLLFEYSNTSTFQSIVDSKPQFQVCSGIPTRLTEPVTTLPHPIDGIPSTLCQGTDADSCSITYYVVVMESQSAEQRTFAPLQIDMTRVCPVLNASTGESFDYLPLILGIVLGLLFAGILMLLIWRIYTWHSDRKEYNNFLKAQKNQDWSKAQNPLFKPSTQKFENPTFGN